MPFAVVMMSGIIPKTSSEEKKCPNLPKLVTTSSDIYRISYFLHRSQNLLIYPFGGTIQPPEASIG